jgi:oligopeptide/dipeptide ABC transporter ATP-binding protein
MASNNLLEIKDLTVELMTQRGIVYALSGVDMDLKAGEIHGIVGESGCGKSMTAKSILRLHNTKRSRLGGQILFEGEDILKMNPKSLEKLRGSAISMIFQDPMTSLNPLMTVGEQIGEMYRFHVKLSKEESRSKAMEMLEKVGLTPVERRYKQYPFELSGGMQQRVMIAMAIACSPKLLIADEPTTALDMTIQAQILDLIRQLSKDMKMSVLLITHNFGVVAETCERISVRYAGRVVESGMTNDILSSPMHPYSSDLIASIPDATNRSRKLESIPGFPPTLYAPPSSCQYADRCRYSDKKCKASYPKNRVFENSQVAACFKSVKQEAKKRDA